MSNQFQLQNNEDELNSNDHDDEIPQEQSNVEPQNLKLLAGEKKENKESVSKKISTDTAYMGFYIRRNKLVEQHIKLKNQLKELATKMDEIVEKQKERKKKKYALNPAEEDERVAELKRELKDQESRIQKNKVEIARLRRNLDNKYDINKIVEKQNQLKHLKKQLQSLEDEKDALEKIRKTQDKAIKSGEDKETNDKIAKMEEELKQLVYKTKKQVESINEKEKQIRKLHEAYIVKEQKVREIQAKAKDKKNTGEDINEYTIAQLEEEIKSLELERIQTEKEGSERIRALERERKELKNELDRKKLILDEKQKELRLNQMKHKQIVRLINSNPQQQSSNVQESQKESKGEGKRVLAKRGREAPKIQPDNDDMIDDN